MGGAAGADGWTQEPTAHEWIRQRVCRFDGQEPVLGTIVAYKPADKEESMSEAMWRVYRDDGVAVELEADRVMSALTAFESRNKELEDELQHSVNLQQQAGLSPIEERLAVNSAVLRAEKFGMEHGTQATQLKARAKALKEQLQREELERLETQRAACLEEVDKPMWRETQLGKARFDQSLEPAPFDIMSAFGVTTGSIPIPRTAADELRDEDAVSSDALARWQCDGRARHRERARMAAARTTLRKCLSLIAWRWEADAVRMNMDTKASGRVVPQVDCMTGKKLRGEWILTKVLVCA